MWQEIGRLQFDYLVGEGLLPGHYLLDIGCGSLRGGVHFIGYLDTGHYYGLEKERWLLVAGQAYELTPQLTEKNPVFILNDSFDLPGVSVDFDFMLAQSVFTHLMPRQIVTCLRRVKPWLKGSLYATFFESDKASYGKPHGARRGERSAARYPLSDMQRMARAAGMQVEYIGEWAHPRGQRMLRFYVV